MRSRTSIISIVLIIGVIILQMVVARMGENLVYATASTTESKTPYNILEIQPSRNFELTVDMYDMLAISHEINITQMSMKEFISKIEEINGTYDMVYIGNRIVDNITYTAVGEAYPANTNLPQGSTQGTEYYSNNDITNRRANGLKAFIESGQLCIISPSILTDSNLRNTKLYENLNPYKDNDNVVLVDDLEEYFTYSNGHSNGLLGQYFNYPSFRWGSSYNNGKHNSVYRIDETIDYNWGTGNPIGGINGTKFAVIWTGQVRPKYTEDYTFYTHSDDGVKLWVNGELIINQWNEQSVREHSGTLRLEAGKFYDIKLEYFDRTLYAEVHLKWSSDSQTKEVIPKEALFLPRYNGVKAEYYNYSSHINGINFPPGQTQNTTSIEPNIDNYWWRGKLHEDLSGDRVAIRWTSQIVPQYTETYTFYTQADDGVRLWVNNQELIDEWHLQWNGNYSATIDLEANRLYDIKMEYFEYYGEAQAKLRWSSPSLTKEIIPQNRFLLPNGSIPYTPKTFYSDYKGSHMRPELNITSKPEAYNGTDTSYLEDKAVTYEYDIYNPNEGTQHTATLYMDYNGDSIYEDEEAVASQAGLTNQSGYQMNYTIPDLYTGLIPWKLEVADDVTGVKTYEKGYLAVKGETREIRVLHLTTSHNQLHMNQLTDVAGVNLIDREGEYSIETTEIPIGNFASSYPNAYNGKETVLNGNYDVVMMGFTDAYDGDDIRDNEALSALRDFVDTKQGLILSHDMLTFRMDTEYGFAYHITKALRDIIGQNIYIGETLDEDMPSYGFSDYTLDSSRNGLSFTLSGIHEMNEGMITKYPSTISNQISTTHYQYFQLNMEEDIVPWYTLSGDSRINQYDARNAYHTYSKDNITFSNVGHATLNNNDKKLLVNTILKTYLGANHKPDFTVEGLADHDNILTSQDTISFEVNGTDIDGLDQNLHVAVYLNNLLAHSTDITSDVSAPITVPKNIDDTISDITVRIVVSDADGAKTEKRIQVTHHNLYDGPTIVATPTSPTNGQVTITLTTDEIYEQMRYRIGETGAWENYVNPVQIHENITIYAKLVNASGHDSTITEYTITNIDKTLDDISVTPIEQSVFKISRFVVEYRWELTRPITHMTFQLGVSSGAGDNPDYITFPEAGASIRGSSENEGHVLMVNGATHTYTIDQQFVPGDYIIRIPIVVKDRSMQKSSFLVNMIRYKTGINNSWIHIPSIDHVNAMKVNVIKLPKLL